MDWSRAKKCVLNFIFVGHVTKGWGDQGKNYGVEDIVPNVGTTYRLGTLPLLLLQVVSEQTSLV